MQIVIDIPNSTFTDLKKKKNRTEVDVAVLNGTPLPKGHWIPVNNGLIVTSYKCSECGRTVRDDTGYDVTKDYPHCHCGAKMVELQESEKV